MKRKGMMLLLSIAVLAMAVSGWANAQEMGDGIPDNCEYTGAAYYQANAFPRYEPSASRVVLVDWTTGTDVRELETGLVTGNFQVRGWSADCHYLAGAIMNAAGNYDTVVWDAVNGGRVGTVADGVGRPHYITWGFGSYLVVETRNGAVLWNVSSNSQLILTTAWDSFAVRNFSRLRWDAANNQLIANVVGAGRVIYDLATGQEVVIAASADEIASGASYVVVGGNRYECQNSRATYNGLYYGGNAYIQSVYPIYRSDIDSFVLANGYRDGEILQVIEDNLDVDQVINTRWSRDCIYLAASVGNQQRTNTVVWDMRTLQRVAVFEDAYILTHQLRWSPYSEYAVIETGEGAFLWHIPSDTRTLLTSSAFADTQRRGQISNFYELYWDVSRARIYAVTRDMPDAVTVFDAYSGATIGQYSIGGHATPVTFSLLNDGNQIFVITRSSQYDHTLTPGFAYYDLNTGSGAAFAMRRDNWAGAIAISPDGRYVVDGGQRVIDVWDLQNPTADGSANNRLVVVYGRTPQFIDSTTVQTRDWSTNTYYQYNIATGELVNSFSANTTIITTDASISTTASTTANSANGFSGAAYFSFYPRSGTATCPYRNGSYYRAFLAAHYDPAQDVTEMIDITNGTDMVLLDGAGTGRFMGWSPDCHFFAAEVSTANSVPYDDGSISVNQEREENNSEVVIWDTVTGARVYVFDNPAIHYRNRPQIHWSPTGERAIVSVTTGVYLWESANNSIRLLTMNAAEDESTGIYVSGYNQNSIFWDYGRGQVLIPGWSSERYGGMVAFDMQTGVERHLFRGGYSYVVSDDQTLLYLSTSTGMVVWNMDTLESVQVDIDNEGTAYNNNALVSPDGNYLVIARDFVRVWNLAQLPVDFQLRDPIALFQGPAGTIRSFQFVDNTKIEVTTGGGEISYWDILTGVQVER